MIILSFLFSACMGAPIQPSRTKGVYHRVERGQNLSMIARAYQVSVLDLVVANSIDDPDRIESGRIVFIPGARAVIKDIGIAGGEDAIKAAPVKEPEAHSRPSVAMKPLESIRNDSEASLGTSLKKEGFPRPVGEGAAAGGDAKVPRTEGSSGRGDSAAKQKRPDVEEKQRFVWPVKGKVLSRFGRQPDGMYYNGIDIAAGEGEAIVAAAGGKVTFSAYLKDYGETIIIQHDDHFSTVYTHLGRRMVKQQDQIKKGEQIALPGKPGKGSGAFLNFGIWHRNKAQDPLIFLP